MSQFDELAAAEKAMPMYPQAQSIGGLGQATIANTREMNVKERVLSHDQRIALLEQQNGQMRVAIERLTQLLTDQFGLQL